ncbi:MAG: hypothetical protein HKN80_11075 [Acidimicrobiia bacterium]|nr:hypothetical protein [Acidimicrobiia bacterium]
MTRIDVIHPAATVDRADIERRLRVRRLKRAASIAAWIAVVLLIALIFFVGSRPASPELDSVARFIT